MRFSYHKLVAQVKKNEVCYIECADSVKFVLLKNVLCKVNGREEAEGDGVCR